MLGRAALVLAVAVNAASIAPSLADDLWSADDHTSAVAAAVAVAKSFGTNPAIESLALLANAVGTSGNSGEATDILKVAATLLSGSDSSDPDMLPQYRGEIVEGLALSGDIAEAEALIPSNAPPGVRMFLLGALGAGSAYGGDGDQARKALKSVIDLATVNAVPEYGYRKPDVQTFGGYDPITAIAYAFVDTTDATEVERLVGNLPNIRPKLLSIIYAVEQFCGHQDAELHAAVCMALGDDAEAALAPAIASEEDRGWKSNIAGLAIASVVLTKGVDHGQALMARQVPPELKADATQAAASFLAIRGHLALAQQMLPASDLYQDRLLQDYRISQNGGSTISTPSEPDSDSRDFDTQFASATAAGPMTRAPSPLEVLLLTTMMFDNVNHKPTPAEAADALKKASQPQPGPQAEALVGLAKRMSDRGDIASALKAEAPLESFGGFLLDDPRSEALEAIANAQIKAGDFESALETTLRIPVEANKWGPLLKLASVSPKAP